MASLFQGLVLGTIQGITEWLPISSEGVNTLVQLHFFHEPLDQAIRVSIWLHAGTLVSALVYFRRDITDLMRHCPAYLRELRTRSSSQRSATTTFLIVSTILTAAVGAPLMLLGLSQTEIPTGLVMAVIGGLLMITGLAQRFAPRFSGSRERTGIKDALILGVVQAFSVFPGLSRSGLTVSALLFRGFDARQAIRLSFLMAIPAVLAAESGLAIIGGASFDLASISAITAAFLFGLLTIGALLRLAGRIRFWKFCLFLGGLSLLPLLLETL